MSKTSRLFRLFISLLIVFLSFGTATYLRAQDKEEEDLPKEQIPVEERETGDSFIENLGEVPGEIVTFPLKLFFKGISKAAGFVDYHQIVLRVTDFLTNEEGTRKVRPIFTPVSGGGLIYVEDNVFKEGMKFRASASFGIRTRTNLYGKLRDTQFFASKLGLQLSGFYNRRPDEDFFGIGQTSRRENRTDYLHEEGNFEMVLLSRPFKSALFAAGFSLSHVNIKDGRDPTTPNTDSLFTEEEVPGFFGAEMWSFFLKVYRDSRNATGHPTSGGEAYFSYEYSQELDGSRFGYSKFTADLRRYVELFYRRVMAFRLRAEVSDNIGAKAIPFYRLGGLGGTENLRGYRRFRFRDKDLILASLEYRWPIHPMVVAYSFLEEGRVFADVFDEFTIDGFKYSFGGGLRFTARNGNLSAIFEMAKSQEQLRFNFGLNTDLRRF